MNVFTKIRSNHSNLFRWIICDAKRTRFSNIVLVVNYIKYFSFLFTFLLNRLEHLSQPSTYRLFKVWLESISIDLWSIERLLALLVNISLGSICASDKHSSLFCQTDNIEKKFNRFAARPTNGDKFEMDYSITFSTLWQYMLLEGRKEEFFLNLASKWLKIDIWCYILWKILMNELQN